MRYMLDTNICIAVMKGDTAARNSLRNIPIQDVGISGIVLAEFAYGVKKVNGKNKMKRHSPTSAPCVRFGTGLFKPRTHMGRYVHISKQAARLSALTIC